MTDDINDLRDTIIPKSDQLNSDDLLTGPINVTVTGVRRGSRDQPVEVHIDGGHKPFKPCKSMRRLLIVAWGNDGAQWAGRSMTLFCDPEVKFGGVKMGGIRISHLSHIERELTLSLMVTRGKRKPYVVKKLADPAAAPREERHEGLTAILGLKTDPNVRRAVEAEGLKGKPPSTWTEDQIIGICTRVEDAQPGSPLAPWAVKPEDEVGLDAAF